MTKQFQYNTFLFAFCVQNEFDATSLQKKSYNFDGSVN